MSAFSLVFRLDAPPAPGDDAAPMLSAASGRLRKAFAKANGLRITSVAWASIDVESPRGRAVLRALEQEVAAGRATVGSAALTETITTEVNSSAEWFYLTTKQVDEFNLWDDHPGYRGGSLPKVHALNHTFVSSAFVEACARRGLTGIAFLQCVNRGRKAGPPWFVALPDAALGRGLDHPWFDRARWLRDVAGRADRRTSALRMGQSQFHQCWLREAAMAEEPLARLLKVCPQPPAYTSGIDGFQVVTIPRYWTAALPRADFAYLPWGEDGPNRAGKMTRFRQLAVGARARQALIDEGLFDAKAFLAVRSVADPERGVEVLDRPDDPIPPMYSPAELAALRAREAALRGLAPIRPN